MERMHRMEPLGHQKLDAGTDQLVTVVAEQRLGLGVHDDDPPVGADAHDRIWCRLDQSSKQLLGVLDHSTSRMSPAF